MDNSFEGKLAIVIGGSGAIGSEIVRALLEKGCHVAAISRGATGLELLRKRCTHAPHLSTFVADVRCPSDLKEVLTRLLRRMGQQCRLRALIYAVNRSLPEGFMEEISTPLSGDIGLKWHEAIAVHVTGFLECCRVFLPPIENGGHVVALSSAITRLTDETCPPWLYAGHYAAAKAALDELIRWLRRDPLVHEKKILVHRIAPAAVDTPFHHGTPPERRPPALLPIKTVVDEVIAALGGTTAVDKVLVPSIPSQ